MGNLEEVLDFVVEYEHDGATSASENVGESSLEEGGGTFRFCDGGPAVERVLVQNVGLLTSRLHHHTPTHSVEGIRDDSRNCRDSLERKITKIVLVTALTA